MKWMKVKGQISILIIWAMLFFIFIVLSFTKRTTHETKMVSALKENVQAYFLLWDAILNLEKILKRDDPNVDSFKDEWVKAPIKGEKPEGKWKIEMVYDEESLININKMVKDAIGKKILKRIFGMYPEYYLCLLDWIDKDDIPSQDSQYPGYSGAEKDDPFYNEHGYKPRNGPMRSLFEIFLIKGGIGFLPTETKLTKCTPLFSLLPEAEACHPGYVPPPTKPAPLPTPPQPPPIPQPPPVPKLPPIPIREPSPTGTGLTLYGDGRVNINTAWDPVLRALGFERETVRRILSYRIMGGIFTKIDANYIINKLVSMGCLDPKEQLYNSITRNIRKVVNEGKLKVNSQFFRAKIKVETKGGAIKLAIVVLKRIPPKRPEEQTVVKVVNIWENLYL